MKKIDLKSALLLRAVEQFESDGFLDSIIFFNLIEETDEETTKQILEHFAQALADAQKSINEENDDSQLAFFSHKLKSSSHLLGFIRFSKLCENLENSLRNKTSTNELIEVYKISLNQITQKLNKILLQ